MHLTKRHRNVLKAGSQADCLGSKHENADGTPDLKHNVSVDRGKIHVIYICLEKGQKSSPKK